MSNWLDLHMHSNISDDGEFAPQTLMRKCFEAGLRAAALTDHNSTRGIKTARKAAEQFHIDFIAGAELDCYCEAYHLHLLCYGIDEENAFFSRIEEDVERQEREASQKRLELVRRAGIAVDGEKIEKLSVRGIITGEMIAEAALEDSRNSGNPLLTPYRAGGARSDNPFVNFYWDFCSQGKFAYVPMKFIELSEAVKIVKAMGGIAVLAHPHVNIGKNLDALRQILNCGIDGIEVYSSYHEAEAIKFYLEQAKSQNLLITAGSDFHGKIKPAISFGNMRIEKQEDILSALMNRLKG